MSVKIIYLFLLITLLIKLNYRLPCEAGELNTQAELNAPMFFSMTWPSPL